MLLAKFFQVHPGYLVDDPEGYSTELISDFGALEDKLDLWLISGAERFRNDSEICHSLIALAKHPDSRRCLVLLGLILENPGLLDRICTCTCTTQVTLATAQMVWQASSISAPSQPS